MDSRLLPLLTKQGGVLARRQALAVGLTAENIDRLRRRNDLAVIHPGVYVDHTGEPSWEQRAWAAVLWGWPAVLSHSSAIAVVEGSSSPHRSGVIEIGVARDRRLFDRPGVAVRRSGHVRERTKPGAPPRIRYDDAVLDVVARMERIDDLVAELGRVVQLRRTTPGRLQAALEGRDRIRHRHVMVGLLNDVATGATSALERTYLHDVERAHGLPGAHRQLRDRTWGGVVYRDALYEIAGRILLIELDGGQFHTTPRQRDRDLDRDLVARIERAAESVRLGWGQCAGRPCRTAGLIGAVMRGLGWTGEVGPCSPGCQAPDVFLRAAA